MENIITTETYNNITDLVNSYYIFYKSKTESCLSPKNLDLQDEEAEAEAEDFLENITSYVIDTYKILYKEIYGNKLGGFSYEYFQQVICHIINNLNTQYHFIETSEEKLLYKKRLEELKLKPKQKQKTKEWYDFRKTALTASNITKIIHGKTNEMNKIILSKCGIKTPFISGQAIMHGNKYEDIAIKIYELRTSKKVYEFGCIRHEDFSFLAASPDGIDEDGVMIEIKCVYSRKISGVVPKDDYYDQMQLQMEVCDLNKCMFLECGILEYDHFEEYEKDIFVKEDGTVDETKNSKGLEKGVIFRRIEHNSNISYIYAPINFTHKQVEYWVKKQTKKIKKKDPDYKIYMNYEPLYWKLDTISCIPVYRDYEWLNRNLLSLSSFWKRIKYFRINDRYLSIIEKINKKNKQKKNKILQFQTNTCYILSSDEEN